MKSEKNAVSLADVLRQRNFHVFVAESRTAFYRVLVGPYSDAPSAATGQRRSFAKLKYAQWDLKVARSAIILAGGAGAVAEQVVVLDDLFRGRRAALDEDESIGLLQFSFTTRQNSSTSSILLSPMKSLRIQPATPLGSKGSMFFCRMGEQLGRDCSQYLITKNKPTH